MCGCNGIRNKLRASKHLPHLLCLSPYFQSLQLHPSSPSLYYYLLIIELPGQTLNLENMFLCKNVQKYSERLRQPKNASLIMYRNRCNLSIAILHPRPPSSPPLHPPLDHMNCARIDQMSPPHPPPPYGALWVSLSVGNVWVVMVWLSSTS